MLSSCDIDDQLPSVREMQFLFIGQFKNKAGEKQVEALSLPSAVRNLLVYPSTCAYMRARNIIYVCSIFFLFCCFQKVLVMSCCKSACYKQVSKKCKKNQMICLAVRLKPPTFAPAIERDAALKQCVTDLVRQAQESFSFIKDSAPDILPQPG